MAASRHAEETREWLRLAASDLRMAELGLNDVPPVVGGALYHCQQAAEKALKGFLVFRGIQYPLTHNLGELLRLCSTIEQSLEAEVLPAVKLTEFATLFRYPGELEQPTLVEAQDWLELARGVYEDVRRRLPAEARD
jgi:HEPN domain-containing protein